MANVHDFGARADGQTDDTAAISHAVQQGDGELLFPRGDYVLSQPIYVPLHLHGRFTISGLGGTARLLMTGAGPTLYLVGTHRGTAHPTDFREAVWNKERMPTVRDLEIVGGHPAADGIRLEGTMQPTLQCVLIRKCRHGIHLIHRNRNVLIADCHIYDNSGVGIFLDHVNLHQTNIHGNHISYCKQGGLKIVGGEIRNIQICSNDIEYNYDLQAPTSADVLFDCRNGTVREGTIVGNTIQAVGSPDGANVRLLGVGQDDPNAVGLLAITGNLLGSQTTVLHLNACRGVAVTGNSIYSGYHNALMVEQSEHLVIGPNSVDHNPQYRGPSTDRIILRQCRNIVFTGMLVQHTRAAGVETTASIDIHECQNINLTGCQVINARSQGIQVRGSSVVRISDCTIRRQPNDATYRKAVNVMGDCRHVLVTNNFLERGSEEFRLPDGVGSATGNVLV